MTQQRVLRTGDLAYWLDDESRPVRVKVELVTRERVYLRATSNDHGIPAGKVWYEGRTTRRVAPRDVVYVHRGKGHFDWRSVLIVGEEGAA